MEAISDRIKQLENFETGLHFKWQATIQQRLQEDVVRTSNRQAEDQYYLDQLQRRDEEEDELRRQRRLLLRSSFAQSLPTDTATTANKGPTTRSKTRRRTGLNGTGPPTTHDSQGRALFTRPSDGKLVYLRCYVAGCDRTTFDTVRALREHVSGQYNRHKLDGIFNSNNHAIELCGEVAPGQDSLNLETVKPSYTVAPTANIASTPLDYTSASETMVESESALDVANRSRSPKTKAQLAAGLYEGFSSSDSEEDIEALLVGSIPPQKIRGPHKTPAKSNDHINCQLSGTDLSVACTEADHQATSYRGTGTVLQAIKTESSMEETALAALGTRFTRPTSQNDGYYGDTEDTSNRKRAASTVPGTPLSKRLRKIGLPSSV